MTERARYTTIRDYVAMLRRRRAIVIASVFLFTAAALATSLAQTEVYEAESAVAYRDVGQDFRFLDVPLPAEQLPSELSERNAQRIASYDFAQRVAEEMNAAAEAEADGENGENGEDGENGDEEGGTDANGFVTADELEAAIQTNVAARTNLVLIAARWEDPEMAARIANSYAEEARSLARQQARQRLQAVVAAAREELQDCRGPSPIRDLCESAAQQSIAQILTLRQIAEPAQIQARAEVPSSVASPNTVRNALLGAFIGLALGLGGAFLRDSLDRKVRSAHDLHQLMDMPVLGRVASSAFGGAGLASAEGTKVVEADLEAFRMLRTNLAFLDPASPPRTVLVTSGMPEEGKSTVAASLAAASAAAGQRTLLVDADLRRPAVADRLGVEPTPGLSEFLIGTAEPQDILQLRKVQLEPGSESEVTLVVIASGKIPGHPGELLASNRCADFVKKVGKAYDLVVIDSSPLLSSVDPLELIPSVDGVLICSRLGDSTRDEMQAVKAALERLPRKPTGLVVTGIDSGDEYYGYYGYDAATQAPARA